MICSGKRFCLSLFLQHLTCALNTPARAFLTFNDLALSAQNISPRCQTPGSFQLEAGADLSPGPFRQASIEKLEMLKTSQPRNNQMIACLKNDMFQTF